MRIADDAPFIQEKHRAGIHAALFVEHAVRAADGTVRPVVRQQGKRHALELLSPHLQAVNGVSTDLQDLGVQFLEFCVVRTEPGDLILSAAGKRKGQE